MGLAKYKLLTIENKRMVTREEEVDRGMSEIDEAD